MPIYEFRCPVCNAVREEIAKQGDPTPLCCTQMERILSATSFAFVTRGGNLMGFSGAHGRVTKGNKKQGVKTIGQDHGLGNSKRRVPIMQRDSK